MWPPAGGVKPRPYGRAGAKNNRGQHTRDEFVAGLFAGAGGVAKEEALLFQGCPLNSRAVFNRRRGAMLSIPTPSCPVRTKGK